jgi:Cu+-exporting ATPase
MASPSVTELQTLRHVTLDIGGMTCASCVRRVEKALNRVDGVQLAEVNLATEVATVSYDPAAATLDSLTTAVGKAGYIAAEHVDPSAAPVAPTPAHTRDEDDAGSHRDAEIARLRRQWQVALTTGLSMMVLMYLPLPVDVWTG